MADQTCSSCGSTMPEGAVFCTQCGSRTLVAADPAAGTDATQAVSAPEPAPVAPADPDPTQVVPQPAATPPPAPAPAPGGYASPGTPAPPAAPSAPPATADPTQSWSAPPAAPASQDWQSAPGTPAPPAAPSGMAPPPSTAPQPAAPPASPGGAGWQAPTQTWDQPPAAPAAPAPPYPGAAAPQQVQPQPGAPAYPAYAPAPAAAPKTAKVSGGGKFGALLGLIGGALAIVGSFLAWVKVAPGNDVAYTVTGWNLSNDAKTTLALGAVAVILAALVLGGQMRGLVRLLFALGGIAVLGVAIYDTYDILKKLPDRLAGTFPDGGAKITGPEIGLILIIAGGVLLIIGALMMKKPKGDVQGFTPR